MPTPKMVSIDPITDRPLSQPQPYYLYRVTSPDGKVYRYLIPEGKNGVPTEREVEETIQRYVENPVPGGRDWRDYVEDALDSI